MKNKVLVIASHPDDETIGCGATIARHISDGDEVKIMTMTNGISSRGHANKKIIQKRNDCFVRATKLLGAEIIAQGDFPDNMLDSVPLLELVKFIEKEKINTNFNIVYTHSSSDLNVDHRLTFQASMTAFRPEPNETIEEIRCFEIPSSTDFSASQISSDFKPNLFINTEKFHEIKVRALETYQDEIREFPHSRSIKAIDALAIVRGSSVGVEKAEAFEVVRKIER